MDTAKPPKNVSNKIQSKTSLPENDDFIKSRKLVILSFWLIVILLGLPIWWKTTSIYRANLPLQEMTNWADGKICKPTFPLRVAVETGLNIQESQNLIKNAQHVLDDLNDFSSHHIRLFLPEQNTVSESLEIEDEHVIVEDDVALLVRLRLKPGVQSPSSKLHKYSSILDVFYSSNQLPLTSSSGSSVLSTYIASQLQSIFEEEKVALSYISSQTSWGISHKIQPNELLESIKKRSTRSFKYSSTYHITFSLFTPSNIPFDWDIESVLESHISPLTKSLSSISNFTIDTQVQLYASFSPSVNPIFDEERKAWILKKDDLSGFINAAEWPLNPNIGIGPTINFILYIPSSSSSPLLIHGTDKTSWIIPQWGGIQILNIQDQKTLTKEQLDSSMKIFSNQLLSLIGIPKSPESLPIRLSTLSRIHTASLIYSASSTLGALSRLTKNLHSIAIPNTVASSVDSTIQHLHKSCSNLREGKFDNALENSRIAESEAEKAFFERSMVGQVYFPDEHKVAVYLPLLGPIAVPLITAAIKELKRIRDGKK